MPDRGQGDVHGGAVQADQEDCRAADGQHQQAPAAGRCRAAGQRGAARAAAGVPAARAPGRPGPGRRPSPAPGRRCSRRSRRGACRAGALPGPASPGPSRSPPRHHGGTITRRARRRESPARESGTGPGGSGPPDRGGRRPGHGVAELRLHHQQAAAVRARRRRYHGRVGAVGGRRPAGDDATPARPGRARRCRGRRGSGPGRRLKGDQLSPGGEFGVGAAPQRRRAGAFRLGVADGAAAIPDPAAELELRQSRRFPPFPQPPPGCLPGPQRRVSPVRVVRRAR